MGRYFKISKRLIRFSKALRRMERKLIEGKHAMNSLN